MLRAGQHRVVRRQVIALEAAHARRGELDGQRQAVEQAHDLRHGIALSGVDDEARMLRAGARGAYAIDAAADLLARIGERPFVVVDLPCPALDAEAQRRAAAAVAGHVDAVLLGDAISSAFQSGGTVSSLRTVLIVLGVVVLVRAALAWGTEVTAHRAAAGAANVRAIEEAAVTPETIQI